MYGSDNFNVPFVRQLEGPMHPGRVVAVYGSIPHHANRFMVNLQCGGGPSTMSDIALHVSVRFDQQSVVRNAYMGGWQHEELDGGLPHHLRRGGQFQMLFLCEPHGFKIAINGQHYREFRHRMPFERVTHVSVEGDVQVNNVSGVMGAHGSAHQTHNPMVPHVQNIGNIYPGRCIRVRGFLPHSAYRFTMNLATGPSVDYDDICLHVSVRPTPGENLVELNTARQGQWEYGQQSRPCPVRLGQHFEMMVMVDEHNYKIAFNGHHFTEFPHRKPYQSVNHIIIDGSVQLQLVSFEGNPQSGGFTPGPPPPPYFPSPYDNFDSRYNHFPNPYPILY